MADKRTEITRRQDQQNLSRRQSTWDFPFRMLDQFANEMDRMFDDFGLGRGWRRAGLSESGLSWAPQVEVSQRHNELIVRADLPGMNKDDITVDVTEDAIAIHGERRREHDETSGGVYRSERSYGSFYREIPLPEGAMADQAKASFKDGVLEITMPAPPEQVTSGRRLEIAEGSAKAK